MRFAAISKILDFFRRDSWRLVHIEKIAFQYTKKTGHMYFYLEESKKGRRKYRLHSDLPLYSNLEFLAGQLNFFNNELQLWLAGRYVPGIARYEDVPADDTATALRGHL